MILNTSCIVCTYSLRFGLRILRRIEGALTVGLATKGKLSTVVFSLLEQKFSVDLRLWGIGSTTNWGPLPWLRQ